MLWDLDLYITTQQPCSAAGEVVVEAAGFFAFAADGIVTETEPVEKERQKVDI